MGIVGDQPPHLWMELSLLCSFWSKRMFPRSNGTIYWFKGRMFKSIRSGLFLCSICSFFCCFWSHFLKLNSLCIFRGHTYNAASYSGPPSKNVMTLSAHFLSWPVAQMTCACEYPLLRTISHLYRCLIDFFPLVCQREVTFKWLGFLLKPPFLRFKWLDENLIVKTEQEYICAFIQTHSRKWG